MWQATGETLTNENRSKVGDGSMFDDSRSNSRVRVGGIFLYVIDAWEDVILFIGFIEGILWVILFVLKIWKFFFG